MKKTIEDFSSPLLDKIKNKPANNNIKSILLGIMAEGSCKLFGAIAKRINDFKKLSRTLTGKNKLANIEPKLMNDTLMENLKTKIQSDTIESIYLIHDPSDIRKKYSSSDENLGKVLDLDGKIINGYSTYNIVALTPSNRTVYPLSSQCYSNKEEQFLSVETIKKLNKNEEFDGHEQARKIHDLGHFFNKKTMAIDEIRASSNQLKSGNESLKITHIFDREFDDSDYTTLINEELKDIFVIRAKKSKIADEKGDDGKPIKLIKSEFTSKNTTVVEKIKFKNKCYENVEIIVEWRAHKEFYAVKITIKDRHGSPIFKDPMLLITNREIHSYESAFDVYMTYLKRSKIESVFRFLKNSLGWENFQIRDFTAIKNMLSLCFFVAAFLYEIGQEVAYDELDIVLAGIGGGKGKVTRHFIFKGIKLLKDKQRVEQELKEIGQTKDGVEILKQLANANLLF